MKTMKNVLLIGLSLSGICYFGYALWNWLLFLTSKYALLRELIESEWAHTVVLNSNWYIDSLPAIGLFILFAAAFFLALFKKTEVCLWLLIWSVFSWVCFFAYDITNQNCQAWKSSSEGDYKWYYANWPFFTKNLENHRWGFIDKEGDFIIEPKFKAVSSFSEGYASACLDWGQYGYIDKTGTFVIEPQFWYASGFSDGLAVFQLPDLKSGLIDKQGKIVLEATYDQLGPYCDGLLSVKTGEKFGYIDRTGATVIDSVFERVEPFSEGLAAVVYDNYWGFIDKTGQFVIKPQYHYAQSFSEGFAVVQVNNKRGFIDHSGLYLVDPNYLLASNFKDGTAWISEDGKRLRQIDRDGNVLREFDRKYVTIAREGMSLDYKNGKAGFLDDAGNQVIHHKYNASLGFEEGLAAVSVSRGAVPRWFTYLLIICFGIILQRVMFSKCDLSLRH